MPVLSFSIKAIFNKIQLNKLILIKYTMFTHYSVIVGCYKRYRLVYIHNIIPLLSEHLSSNVKQHDEDIR